MTSSARFSPTLGAWTLGALLLGLVLGAVGNSTGLAALAALADSIAPLGTLWINALQMTVIPLVVTQLLVAIVRPGGASAVGKLGGGAVALFLTLLIGAGLMTWAVAPWLLQFYEVSSEVVASVRVDSIPESALAAARSGPIGLGEWIIGLIPRNPVEAAAQGNIMQILVFTVLVGLAVGSLPADSRDPLATVFRSLADAIMVMVSWVLWGTPLGVFSIILGISLQTGLGAVGLLGWYIGPLCGLLILATLLLYPITALFGRTSLRTFARAAAPAQLVAIGTQSSLASLPALIDGGKSHMKLPEVGTGFVLPLCVSTFKLNQGISPIFKFLLLSHFFGIPLGVGEITTFIMVATLLSFSTVGVPRGGGGFKTLPLYIAAGIPIEGVVLIEAVKTIPDFFMTLLNVTADMSAATLLTRSSRSAATMVIPSPASEEGVAALGDA